MIGVTFEILSRILQLPKGQDIYFEEIVSTLSRQNAEKLLVRLVPIFSTEKKSWKKFFAKETIQGYALEFGSSQKSYSTTQELQQIFEHYFGIEAELKAAELFIPLTRVFLRKGITIPANILSEIEEKKLFWTEKRKLGRQFESIVYFVFAGKLIRIDSERERITPYILEKIQERLTIQYPKLSNRPTPTFALHEIHLTEGKSLLLPNDDELLSDVDKAKIRNVLLSSPDSPQKFAQKLEALLAFRIALLSHLKQEESYLYPHILQGSVFNFIAALNSVVRWSRQPEKGVLTFQDSRDPKDIETDLDHTLTMLAMASRIFSGKYPELAKAFDRVKVLNGIFVHDGGEPFSPFGDVTHADEQRWQALRQTKDEAENAAYTNWWQQRMKLQNVQDELVHELYGSFASDQDGKSKEGLLVKFLDHFQAIVYGVRNIYPYESVYKDVEKVGEYVQKYAVDALIKVEPILSKPARDELRKFFVNELPLSYIEESYKEAVDAGRIDKELADKLVAKIKATLSIHQHTPQR